MATLFGLGKDEAPTNGDLGSLAYMNATEVEIDNGRAALDEYQKAYTAPKIKPTLNLPFAKMQNFDPRVSFSRASDAYAYEGDSQKAEENLVLYSEQFDNAYWDKLNSLAVANQTLAPNGTNTADSFEVSNTNNAEKQISRASVLSAGQTITTSIFAKPNQLNFLTIFIGTTSNTYASVTFDLTTGATTQSVSNGAGITLVSSISVASVNGFFRLSLTATINSGVGGLGFALSDTGTFTPDDFGRKDFVGNVGDGVFIWGAQLEQRDTLTDYQRTTDRIIQRYIDVYSLVTSNKPRFKEIDPVTKERKGLLVEEARANLLLQSNGFDTASWTKQNATIQVGIPSPLGAGYKLIANANSGAHLVTQAQINNGTAAFSIYAKESEFYKVKLRAEDALAEALFDLRAQTSTLSGGVSSSIEKLDNGWFRLTLVATTANVNLDCSIYLINNEGLQSFTGDGYSGIYISQAQLEVGSFPTSPILTVASAVTRAVDISLVRTSLSGVVFNSAGSFVASGIKSLPESGSSTVPVILLGLGAEGNNNASTFFGFDGRLDVVGATPLGLPNIDKYRNTFGLTIKLAASYEELYTTAKALDGYSAPEEVPIDPDFTQTPISILGIGNSGRDISINNFWNGHIDHVAYYPQALTAEELAFLTRNTSDE